MKNDQKGFVTQLLIIVAGLFAVVLGYVYFSDQVKLGQIKSEITWLDGFYTTNARYPHSAEFDAQFPYPNVSQEYLPNNLNEKLYPDETSDPQKFEVRYKLTSPLVKSYAIGKAEYTLGPFNGYYDIFGCNNRSQPCQE